jgi:hypothetical protein
VSRARETRLELLVGSRVRALRGAVVGRIEEVRAERRGASCFVTEYHIGPAALLERLSARFLPFRQPRGFIAQWHQLDPSDPERPRLLCPVSELEPMRKDGA